MNFFFKGKECLKLNNMKTEIRKNFIGYIFQNNQLLEDFTVLENIALPLILMGEEFSNAKKSIIFFRNVKS